MTDKAFNGHILIVDDEPDMLSTIADLLQSQFFKTVTATNGQAALDAYGMYREEISLVLCDISMPVMNGLEFFTKGLALYGYMPIVMVTAHADVPRMTEAIRLGAIDYLVKPFEPQDFAAQIIVWQEVARRSQQNRTPQSAKMEGLMRIRNAQLNKPKKVS